MTTPIWAVPLTMLVAKMYFMIDEMAAASQVRARQSGQDEHEETRDDDRADPPLPGDAEQPVL